MLPILNILFHHIKSKSRMISKDGSSPILKQKAYGGNLKKRLSVQIQNRKRSLIISETIKCILLSKKFWIWFIGLVLSILAIVHWLFSYASIVKQHISVVELVSRQLGIQIVIYYVFRKASKSLSNKEYWMNYRLRPLFIAGLVFNIIFISYLEYQMIRVTNEELEFEAREKSYDKISCLSPIWLISALVEFFTVLIFYELVHKITENTTK